MAVIAPYKNDHKDTNGPGDARPTALKIVRDQNLDGKLTGKIFLITGCSAGIGVETARALHATGADVYITGRNKHKGEQVTKWITEDGKPGKVVFLEMELGSLSSVKDAASRFLQMSKTLNVLICNAGVVCHPQATTEDGFEMHFGVNHVGHFALFEALKPALLASATAQSSSRVVMLSSLMHQQASFNFDDYNLTSGKYDAMMAYAASKTANIWMANEIERRYGAQGLHATSVHPGAIQTEASRHSGPATVSILEKPESRYYVKSPEQGAATTVWAAVGKEWEHRGGRYLGEVQEQEPMKAEIVNFRPGYAPHAYNEEGEKRLWQLSLELIGVLT